MIIEVVEKQLQKTYYVDSKEKQHIINIYLSYFCFVSNMISVENTIVEK